MTGQDEIPLLNNAISLHHYHKCGTFAMEKVLYLKFI